MLRTFRFPGFLLSLVALMLAVQPAAAQYFGRNKVQYDDFDFRQLETTNFEVYFYPEEEQAVQDAARMAERWYRRHSRTFLREFSERKPIIFYANDADFQQTNVIRGQIGQGTGGVTESLKERVVMPLTGSYAQTDHVLGHELVHSFQYDIALRGDVEGFSLRRLPLWLVEGMAEYLSVGRDDPHTAMWLRDAVLRDDLPSVEQLTRDPYTYFPYRYGQAYMAYVGGKYGDAAVTNLYKLSGRVGLDSAFVYALGISADSLSNEWKQAVRDTYAPELEGRTNPSELGRAVIGQPGEEDQLNISPVISPDGRYVAFIARRSLFNTNIYVADAETGEVIQELQGTKANPHFDALRFINSAGSWSPDGRRLAFITFVDGDNEINTLDVESGKISKRTAVQGIGAINNLAWSPDGRYIAFSGLDGGISDLYVLDLETNKVRQLTNDRYADLQPAWSPDGQTIAFATDRGPDGTDFQTLNFAPTRLGLINVETREIQTIRPFQQGQQHNPQFSPDGRSIYFISNHDGFKDVYRYARNEEQTYRVTRLKTGVSGITAMSPAMSVAGQNGRMVFSVYANSGYSVVALEADETQGERATPIEEGVAVARLLPPPLPEGEGLVSSYLDDPLSGLPEDERFATKEYSNRLRLDRIAPPTVGTSFGGPFGTQVAGGVGFFFSDMLGNQNLDVFVQANGTFKDIGGLVSYTNRGNRLNYGGAISHIPTVYGAAFVGFDEQGNRALVQRLDRIYRTSVGIGSSYPLSQTNRFEVNAGAIRYGFEREQRVIDAFGRSQTIEFSPYDPLYLARFSGAYVGDFSNFGFTSPLQGGRYRFEVAPHVGSKNFVGILADYRRYLFWEPFTMAFRGLHVGNYGTELTSDISDIFARETLYDPYQLGFVRGYSLNMVLDDPACQQVIESQECGLSNLLGTRAALASAELRFPLLGSEALGLINFPYLPTELVTFFDAGVAWTNEDLRNFSFSTSDASLTPDGQEITFSPARPVYSAGVATRFNVLGAVILEMFYVYPFQRDSGWELGATLRPGW